MTWHATLCPPPGSWKTRAASSVLGVRSLRPHAHRLSGDQYPAISHSFIRREILAFERQGVEVVRIALRGWADELVDEEDRIERKRTRYVLREGAPGLLLALARTLLTRPASLIRALALACRIGRRAERPLFVHLIYLAEACRIESWLRETGVQHLHAHFGTNSAEVAMLVHALGGPAGASRSTVRRNSTSPSSSA